MKRSWLRASNLLLIALAAILCLPHLSFGQDKQAKHPAANHGKKKRKHTHTKVITHGSDDDKKLREIKTQKEKEKVGK